MTAEHFWRSAALTVFLLGVLLVAMTRGAMTDMVPQFVAGFRDFDESCLSCHRNTAWLYHLVHLLLTGLSQLFFLGPETGPLAVPTPWDYVDAASHNRLALVILAYYGHRAILAIPLYLAACHLFTDPRHRLVYVVTMLALLGGWPAVMINGLFNLAQIFVDWPPSYYLFPHAILNFDWASLGFVHLLMVALLRSHDRVLWAAPLYAVLGQVMMDNLGFVAGVVFFLAHLGRGQKARAVLTLALCGLASALVLWGFAQFGQMQMERQGMAAAAAQGGLVAGAEAWLGHYWHLMGKYNFLWLNVTIANFLSMMFWPALMGLGLGFVLPGLRDDDTPACLRAAALPAMAFFLTLCLAMFKSGLGSDMGRQALPLASLVLPLAWMTAARLRRR